MNESEASKIAGCEGTADAKVPVTGVQQTSPQAAFPVTVIGHGDKKPPEFPRRRPPSAKFVCASEVAWSRWHSSDDRYHLSRSKTDKYWILWHAYFDDNEEMRWITSPIAYCLHHGLQPRTAAFFLMLGLLGKYDTMLENFMGMREGLVRREDVRAMGLLIQARPLLTGELPARRKSD